VSIELRHLRHFVAVAEELHFTRAAERLHMAQQPLSASIARLETLLGVRLLERSTRRVELTEAGVAFLAGARETLAAADAAVAAARGAGERGEVTIGVSSGAWYGLAELFEELEARHPGVRVHVRQQSSRAAVEQVAAGELDVAIALCVGGGVRLKDEPVVAVLAASHPLAGAASVALPALAGETFALDDPAEGPGYNAAVLALCPFTPAVRELATHHDAWERAIASGECVGLTTACSVHAAHPGVRAVPVTPAATFPLDLVVAEAPRPVVRTVVASALATAERHGWRVVD
jgi:DNA-binding transcriptional LysR family regulator